jgi:hypothetical protein
MVRHLTAVLLIALACGASARQASSQSRQAAPRTPAERESRRKAEEIARLAESEFDRGRESEERRAARAEFERGNGLAFTPLSEDDRIALAPPAEDVGRFAAFLSQPDTGLVRLLPREKVERKPGVRGGGAYYSFAHLVHEYAYGSDVALEQGSISTGFAGADFGLIFDLGEMPLEDVTADTEPVRFLATFSPPSAEPEARKIQMQLHYGYQHGWFVYRRLIPAVVGHTYVVRAVHYETSDMLVAFRVIREEEAAGGVILLWKTLKKYAPPELRRDAASRR